MRYDEDDFYWADRFLTEEQKMPESDLLKAIHTYAADFYGKVNGAAAVVDYQSMDETALLGLGVLLEEMVWNALGQTGGLAFVEGAAVDEEQKGGGVPPDESMSESVAGNETTGEKVEEVGARERRAAVEVEPITPAEETGSAGGRQHKRRKTRHQKEDG